MSGYPNLKGVATKNLVDSVQAGSFKADYINWSRTMQLLRDNAPGWLPELVANADGGYVHRAGVGAFLLIQFRHEDGRVTPGVPQAIMDNRNAAIPADKITARDITDTHRRGICAAAALTFGLAYELWAKMPLESGYAPPPVVAAPEPVEITDAREVAPPEQVEAFWALVAKVASVDPDEKHTGDWYRAGADRAAVKLYGKKVAQLADMELGALAVRFQEGYGKLKGSGGETPVPPSPDSVEPVAVGSAAPPEQHSAGGNPPDRESVGESVMEATDESPAEQPLFKAPTGPRGSKRQHKDVAA